MLYVGFDFRAEHAEVLGKPLTKATPTRIGASIMCRTRYRVAKARTYRLLFCRAGLLAVFAGLCWSPQFADAASITVFSDNFDSGEAVGTDPNNWTDGSATGNDVVISTARANSSPNSMFLDDDNASAAIASTTFADVSGIVTWEFSFNETLDAGGDRAGMLRARLQDSIGTDGIIVNTNANPDGTDELRVKSGDQQVRRAAE